VDVIASFFQSAGSKYNTQEFRKEKWRMPNKQKKHFDCPNLSDCWYCISISELVEVAPLVCP